jgi:Ca2+-binding EF-hand superfamily protein
VNQRLCDFREEGWGCNIMTKLLCCVVLCCFSPWSNEYGHCATSKSFIKKFHNAMAHNGVESSLPPISSRVPIAGIPSMNSFIDDRNPPSAAAPYGGSGYTNVSMWMEALNMLQPIPKLVPVRGKLASVAVGSTAASTARATLGRHKFESLHPEITDKKRQPLLAVVESPRNGVQSSRGVNTAELSSRSLPRVIVDDGLVGEDSLLSSPINSPRERSMSLTMARMQSGLFAGMRPGGGHGADPLSDLRRDLSALFVQDSRAATYFKYLLHFGGPKSKPEYAPDSLQHEEHQLLGLLFGALDRDSDGFITSDNIRNASEAFRGKFGGGDYSRANFRKMDRYCNGKVDFEQFLLAFLPDHTLLSLRHVRKSLAKPLTKLVCSTRELMAAADYEEVQRNFRYFVTVSRDVEDELNASPTTIAGRPTASRTRCRIEGISLVGYLSMVKDPDARAFAEQLFGLFDTDGDGVLAFDDFLEMMKHNYPPFRKGNRYGVSYGYLEQPRGSVANSGPNASHRGGTSGGLVAATSPRGSGQGGALLFGWRDFNEEEKAQAKLYVGIASKGEVVDFPKAPPRKKGPHVRRGSEALASIAEMRDKASMAIALLK